MTGRGDRTGRAAQLALSVATIAFALVFVYPAFAEQAIPFYYPLERRWAWEVLPSGLAIDFYGRLLLAIAVATPVGLGAWAVGRRAWIPGDRGAVILTGWALTAVLLAMLHFGWHLYFRTPIPEPLPDWYVPR